MRQEDSLVCLVLSGAKNFEPSSHKCFDNMRVLSSSSMGLNIYEEVAIAVEADYHLGGPDLFSVFAKLKKTV